MIALIKNILAVNSIVLTANNYRGNKNILFSILCKLAAIAVLIRYVIIVMVASYTNTAVNSTASLVPFVVAVVAIICNVKRKYNLSQVVLFTFLPLSTLYFALVHKESSITLLFLLFSLVSLVFYDKKLPIILTFILNVTCYGIVQSQYMYSNNSTQLMGDVVFTIFNTLLFFCVTFFLLFYLKNIVNQYLLRITNDNDVLAEINTELLDMHENLKVHNTKLEEEQTAIHSSNKHITKILNVIAHDLKSPLVSVNNILKYTKDVEDANTVKEYMPEISKTIQNTIGLLDNLLQWGRNQATQELKQESITFNHILNEVKELYNLQIADKKIRLEIENHLNAQVTFNTGMLHTVLRNLLSNAIKFTPLGGNIKIVISPIHNLYKIQIMNEVDYIEDKTITKLNTNEDVLGVGTAGEMGSGFGLVVAKDFLRSNNTALEFSQRNNKLIIAEFLVLSHNNTILKAIKSNGNISNVQYKSANY